MKRNLSTIRYALQRSRDFFKGMAVLMISGLTFRLQPAETAAAQNRIHLSAGALLRRFTDLCPVNKIVFGSPIACCCGYHTAASAGDGRATSLLSWFVLPPSLFTTCFRTAGDPVRVNFSRGRQISINLTAANNPKPGISSDAEDMAFSFNKQQASAFTHPGKEDLFPLHTILQS